MNIEKIKSRIAHHMKAPEDFEKRTGEINLELLSHNAPKSRHKNTYTLLDCGCGNGENLIGINKSLPIFNKCIGIDIHAPSIEEGKRNFSEGATFICGDCLDMPINSNTIDVILSNQVIEHIPQYNKYLLEIYRVLKPKGLFLISTPNAHCPRNIFLKMIGHKPILRWSNVYNVPLEKYRGHTQEFTETELIELAKAHHFELVESQPILPYPTIKGNWLFNLYSLVEFIFFILSRPFVSKGYSKNTNMLFRIIK